MASLFLIRHGEPAVTGVLLGQCDPPLSEAGRLQAAKALQSLQVDLVWSSPLRRARETANLIGSRRLVELPELREIDLGEWTGKTWVEIEKNWGELASRKAADWLGIPAPGGETWPTFLARIRVAWDAIRAGPMPAAVVAHLGVNAALLHVIEGRDPAGFTQAYGEVIQIAYD